MRRDINNIDDDICFKKRIIEQMLYEDPDIVEVIDNPNIDMSCSDELIYENIYPFIRIPGTQDVSKNFITFMVDDMELSPNNSSVKTQYIKFVIFVHKDLIKTKFGIPRHDLLGYIIKDIFHLSNKFGLQCEIISNREGVTDSDYYTRTLQFKMTTPNSIKPYKTNAYERESIVNNHDRRVQHESV